MTMTVARHHTAMSRIDLSRPVSLALEDGLLESRTVLDYGCGRGDDLRGLTRLGIPCTGWDPVHRPHGVRQPADVVNLGYVVNVIEDRVERADTVRSAWNLAKRLLIISGRLLWEARDLRGRPMGDGVMTGARTFQKFFTQEELRTWITQVLDVQPIAAAPGIFYVFRDRADAQSYLAKRVSSRAALTESWVSEALFERHHDLLQPLVRFLSERARLPRSQELPETAAIRSEVGSLARAFALIAHNTGQNRWDQLRQAHRVDLLVYIALSRFDRRPRFSELPEALQFDVKEFFGSYSEACSRADQLLLLAGNAPLLSASMQSARVGKAMPSALYVHRAALGGLPPLLRVYEGCARVLSGEVEGATLVKLAMDQPQISYLSYPGFDQEAHPALHSSVVVNLRRLTVDFRDFRNSTNPPILHRKEEFLAPDDPRRDRFCRLTAAEVKAGLYEDPISIGHRLAWESLLASRGLQLRGHRLFKLPLSAPTGRKG